MTATTTDPTVAQLTLTSCDPVYTARNRIAVHAFLVASESDLVGEPTYYDLEANGNLTGSRDDPAVRPESTDAGASTTDVGTVAAGSTEASTEPAPSDTAPVVTAPAPSEEVQDAFAEGWFHDDAA